MLPPPLSKVLRPCHPSWRAFQIRSVANAPRKVSTNNGSQTHGDQQPSTPESGRVLEPLHQPEIRTYVTKDLRSSGPPSQPKIRRLVAKDREIYSWSPSTGFSKGRANPATKDTDLLVEKSKKPRRRSKRRRESVIGSTGDVDNLKNSDGSAEGEQLIAPRQQNDVIPPEQSSSYPDEAEDTCKTEKVSKQASVHEAVRSTSSTSLLEELFPEVKRKDLSPTPTPKREVPRLFLPNDYVVDAPIPRPATPTTRRERLTHALQSRGEEVTVLTLSRCSTELSESDFRRLIPKGRHIEAWIRDGEFYDIIPGRDPISLERLPFYYLLFKTPGAALAYQENAARLHKLARLHTPGDAFSAIPPTPGLLEDGEDLHAAVHSYTLVPPTLLLRLNIVHQPYQDSFRSLIAQGGYHPVVSASGKKTPKVLLRIEGYEIGHSAFYKIIFQGGRSRGIPWAISGGPRGLSRLEDLMDKSRIRQTATNPDAPANDLDDGTKGPSDQAIQKKLYNRWIVDFEDEDEARRFARVWHRKTLPYTKGMDWKDSEQERICNAEFLW